MDSSLEKSNKVGRPTRLTEKLTLEIRSLYFSGKSIKNIQELLSINSNTWDCWYYNDSQGFRAKFNEWKKEKMLKRAENNLEEFLEIEDIKDPKLMKMKLETSIYITETLGKEIYSKKIIKEDPESIKREEMDALREQLKNMTNIYRDKNRLNHKDKMKNVLSV